MPFELGSVVFEELLWEFPNMAFNKDDSDELLLWFLLNILEYDAGDNGGVLDLLEEVVDSIIDDGLDGILSLIPDVFLVVDGLAIVKLCGCDSVSYTHLTLPTN